MIKAVLQYNRQTTTFDQAGHMDQGDITPLLEQVQRGNTEAQSQLASAVYNELPAAELLRQLRRQRLLDLHLA